MLSGHDHIYERLLTNDLLYLVNGLGGDSEYFIYTNNLTAGSQVQYNENFGAMRIEATETKLAFQFITISNELIYTFIITNEPPLTGPLILCQSVDQSGWLGTNLTLLVAAQGAGTLTYQWQFNQTNIAGATNAVFVIMNVQRTNDGTYRVLVTDERGSLFSEPIVLSVIVNPIILRQPQNQAVNLGAQCQFRCCRSGI